MPDIGSTQTRWSCTFSTPATFSVATTSCLPLTFVGDDAPQFGDAILDDDIDMRRPVLLAQRRDDVVADRGIAARRSRNFTG